MSEAYWIGGLNSPTAEYPETFYAELLKSNHLRAEHVDELHWIMDNLPPVSLPSENRSVSYCWKSDETLEMTLLASIGRSLRLYERDVTGWLSWHAFEKAAAIMASPRAVGRYNLPPRARLSLNLGFLNPESLEEVLRKNDLDPRSLSWVSLPEDWAAGELSDVFSGARCIQGPRGLMTRLQKLVETLEEEKADSGLLLSKEAKAPFQALWVDRI